MAYRCPSVIYVGDSEYRCVLPRDNDDGKPWHEGDHVNGPWYWEESNVEVGESAEFWETV